MIGGILSTISFILYYKRKADTVFYTMIYVGIRNGARMMDLENTIDEMPAEKWLTLCIL